MGHPIIWGGARNTRAKPSQARRNRSVLKNGDSIHLPDRPGPGRGNLPKNPTRAIDPVEQIVTYLYMKSLALAVLLTSAAFGQTTKTDIAIHCVSLPGDIGGGQLCSALRDALASSPRYQEVDRNPQGWQLRLATMGIDDNKGTAVSMTLVYHAIYVVNTVQVCGASVIPDSLKACCLIPMITVAW